MQAWVATVSEAALHDLDLNMLRDLLRIEADPALWEGMAAIVAGEIERRTQQGDAQGAQMLAESLVRETTAETDGRRSAQQAARIIERLSSGPLVRHVGLHLRKVEDADVEPLNRLCHTIGAGVVRPLAELLAIEENTRATGRLRELLLGFGAAGRQSVEKLKNSPNPAVRRTAIDLLRVFGGQEALPELASMLDDADPQVQRESIRAIVQIGTNNAYAVLQRALIAGSGSRETVLQELLGLRDDKAAPLLCYVLRQTQPTGELFQRPHRDDRSRSAVSAAHPESIRTLQARALYAAASGHRSGPRTLRRAAATALRRIGTSEATAVLDEAVAKGPRGVRSAARAQAGRAPRPETRTDDMNATERARLADELLRRLAAAIRGAQLYAPGHPLVTRSITALARHAGARRITSMPVGRHRHRRRRARRRRHPGPARRRDDGRADAAAASRPASNASSSIAACRPTRSCALVRDGLAGRRGRSDRGALPPAAHPRRPPAGRRAGRRDRRRHRDVPQAL